GMRAALTSLAGRLQGIVGPFAATGFHGPGGVDFDNLLGEEGSEGLDGLVYESVDGQSSIVVTTRSLLATWIARVGRKLPRRLVAALATEDFYTFAIESDAAVYKYATIPIPDQSRLGIVT